MDFYLHPENAFERLLREYHTYGSLVVAFDFDDTVYDYHQKGRTYEAVIALLHDLKALNCYLICWTGQANPAFVREYLTREQIPFDAINENPPFYAGDSRKIYANAYLDDRAGLREVFDALSHLVSMVKPSL